MYEYSHTTRSAYSGNVEPGSGHYYARRDFPGDCSESYHCDEWVEEPPPPPRGKPQDYPSATYREDHYDNTNNLYRSDDRYSGRSTRSYRSSQPNPGWYPSNTIKSAAPCKPRLETSHNSNAYPSDTPNSEKYSACVGKSLRETDIKRDFLPNTHSNNVGSLVNYDDKQLDSEVYKGQESSYDRKEGNTQRAPAYGGISDDDAFRSPLGKEREASSVQRAPHPVASYGVLNRGHVVVSAGTPGGAAWCYNGSSTPTAPLARCCRPAILALSLIGTAVLFSLVCGLLLYFNYVNYKPRPAEVEELPDPCRGVQCYHGAECVRASDGRSSECRCPASCPRYGDHAAARQVCGSDARDYPAVCEMRRAACDARANVTVKFHGKCDPCAGVSCPEPEICQLDAARAPSCRCAEACPLEFAPVCASDGKTYSSECHMRREACRSRKQLRVIYRGQCSTGTNPCSSVKCSAAVGSECAIDRFGIARCGCGPPCEPVLRPACGVDGRTYDSECEMARAACEANTVIKLAHAGACGSTGGCARHTCSFGGSCSWRGGRAHCSCPSCSAEFAPVCGSDGISYGNRCKLTLEACKHRRDINVLYDGPCNGCENKKCEFYAVCDSDGASEARCVCPEKCEEGAEKSASASSVSRAVCGSDGRTYSSKCALRSVACRERRELTTLYVGGCELCAGVSCSWGAHCSAGSCVCPTSCGGASEPVCANNMQTFASECELQRAACRDDADATQSVDRTPLTVIFYGDCSERFAVAGVPTPVTSVSSKTEYNSNEIEQIVTEISDKNTSNVERGACADINCDYEATCELGPDGFPRCSCLFDCASAALNGQNKPVCASDLRLYQSMCHMKLEGCQRQEELRLRPLELCKGLEVKPCNGKQPLVDNVTGLQLDCGNGPHRKDCPSGSYCHQTTKVARCCKKDVVPQEKKGCAESWFGCCSDGVTAAGSADGTGCPTRCECHKLGAFSESCDAATRKCACRPGVGGARCDRCEPGYWGLPKISAGHQGCVPCGCSMFGSVREDCEQMTGRCVCKPGVQGQKCTVCTDHELTLGPNGCYNNELVQFPPTSCAELQCHFGAHCVSRGGVASCACAAPTCPPVAADTPMVCGSDGQTYASDCHLRAHACDTQHDVVVQAFGICREEQNPTDWPPRRYTESHYTQPDERPHLSKSTRHLLVLEPKIVEEQERELKFDPYEAFNTINPSSPESTYYKFDHIDNIMQINEKQDESSSSAKDRLELSSLTPKSIVALIGDICSTWNECPIANTMCFSGTCICLEGYMSSVDRQTCDPIARLSNMTVRPLHKAAWPPHATIREGACDSSPCGYSSTCVEIPDGEGGFVCVCQPFKTGRLCEHQQAVDYHELPSFDGRAYAVLKPLKGYHKFNINLEITAFSENGILLYDQQRDDGKGDFISIALVNGHVEMRYNLGDGVISLVTPEVVKLKSTHKISVKRYHRDSVLRVDNNEDVIGQSKGKFKSLDLVKNTYIGFVPTNWTRVYDNIGISQGFIGCMHKLNIGHNQIYPQLGRRASFIFTTSRIRECSNNPCASVPCANGGTCLVADGDSFTCSCVPGFAGDLCVVPLNACSSAPCREDAKCIAEGNTYRCVCDRNHKAEVFEDCHADVTEEMPLFTGSSYIQLPRLESVSKTLTIEIIFLTQERNGILLYAAQSAYTDKGDFVAVHLVDGYMQFIFNLGSGIANVTVDMPVPLNEWVRLHVRRAGRDGAAQLWRGESTDYKRPPFVARDAMTQVGSGGYSARARAPAGLGALDLRTPLYVGGVPSWLKVHRLSGVRVAGAGVGGSRGTGLRGAVQHVWVGGRELLLTRHRRMCPFNREDSLKETQTCSSYDMRRNYYHHFENTLEDIEEPKPWNSDSSPESGNDLR